MSVSANGWRANDRSVISTRNVPGTKVRLAVRKGAPGDLLLAVAARFHREVESIEGTADDWGYAERNIRGSSTTLSNHASGTAIDVNATRHPMGTRATANFSAAQINRIKAICAATGGVVRWGGEWSRPDGMHFELSPGVTEAQCVRALSQIGGAPAASASSGGDPLVRAAQAKLKAAYRAYAGNLVVDGIPGPKTAAAVREFQSRSKLPTTGIVDVATRRALGI